MADILLKLSSDDALVIFELLHRWEDNDRIDPGFPGEQTALWHLSGALERVLTDPFERNYDDLVRAARDRLHKQGGA